MAEAKKLEDIDTSQTYEDTYTVRKVGGGVSTSIPKKIVERKAKEVGLSVDKFIKNYRIRMFYDEFSSIDGAFKFVENEESE